MVQKNQNAGEPNNTQETRQQKQLTILEELRDYSHYLLNQKKAEELLSPFGIDAAQHIRKYSCDYSDPKGLHGFNNEEFLIGLSASDIPGIVMKKLGIKYGGSPFLGRGSDFRFQVDVIIQHLTNLTVKGE